ncbi:uncharacterized protein [Oryza sativa Japonica Group]|nr:uncharacterized protein LOC9271834 [Oryza sativa Japonica Group]KAF2922849.1 hypothetical protein DAI22_07g144100 [Oryza sativa Japonica Group]
MQTRSPTRRKEESPSPSPAMGTRAAGKPKTTAAVGARAARGNKQAGAATKREEATAPAITSTGSSQSPPPEVEPSTRKVEGGEGDSALAKRVRDDEEEDKEAAQAFNFRHFWNFLFSAQANFEDITDIPPMRHTDDPGAIYAKCYDAVQVYSVEVKQIKCGLRWPIEVFGHVAVRDSVDRKRNLVFNRGRDDCQTLTAEDSSLVLTGPSRYVLAMDNPDFEVELKVKGIAETEDKVLSSHAFTFNCIYDDGSSVKRRVASNKRSTVQITFALIPETVEATFEVKVVDGSLDPSLRPHFFASTHHHPSTECVLLDPREGAMVISDNNSVKLTRSVVSVEVLGGLKLTAEALDDEKAVVPRTTIIFEPQRDGRVYGFLDLNCCKMVVKVSWSRLSIC